MKRLIIAIGLLFVALIGVQSTAFAEDNTQDEMQIIGIEFEPADSQTFEPLVQVHGYYTDESGEPIGYNDEKPGTYFWYRMCRFKDGDCLTLKYIIDEDDTDDPSDPEDPETGDDPDDPTQQEEVEEKAYWFDGSKDAFVSEEDVSDVIPKEQVSYVDNQSADNPWTLENDNCSVTVSYQGFNDIHKVVLRELKEIRYYPAAEVVYEERTSDGPGAIYGAGGIGFFQKGDRFIAVEQDDTEHEYVFQYDEEGYRSFVCEETGDVLSSNDAWSEFGVSIENQRTAPWVVGNYEVFPQNYLLFKFSNLTCKVPVTLHGDPVSMIEYLTKEPYLYYEEVNGWFDPGEGIFIYNFPEWREGDRFKVTYSDGSARYYTYHDEKGLVNDADPKDRLEAMCSNNQAEPAIHEDPNSVIMMTCQTSEDPWLTGKDNYAYITYHGRVCVAPVQIRTVQEESIEYVPAEPFVFPENLCGEEVEDSVWDEETHAGKTCSYFSYWANTRIWPGDQLILTMKDNTTVTYVADTNGIFVNRDDASDSFSPQKEPNMVQFDAYQWFYADRWLIDTDNYIKVTFHGLNCNIPVTIIPATQDMKDAFDNMDYLNVNVGAPENVMIKHSEKINRAWEAYKKMPEEIQVSFDRAYEYGIQDYMNALKAIKRIKPVIQLSTVKYAYNGKIQRPSVTVMNGNNKLSSAYYNVTFTPTKNSKNVGTYIVKVELKSGYDGSAAATYQINPAGTSLTKVRSANNGLRAEWKKARGGVTGYQIKYSKKKNFSSGNRIATIKKAATTSKKITRLQDNKTYYLKIRTYKVVNNKRYYSSWSGVKTVTTK